MMNKITVFSGQLGAFYLNRFDISQAQTGTGADEKLSLDKSL